MTIYILIALLIISSIIYSKRNSIKKYLDNEILKTKTLNDIDSETKLLIEKYSTFSTNNLIEILNSGNLSGKELKAVNKVLNDRQNPPSTIN